MEVLGVAVTFGNCLTTCVVIAATYILYEWLGMLAWRRKYNLKGPLPLPLIGTAYKMVGMSGLDEFDRKLVNTYGKLVAGRLGGLNTLLIADTDLLKKVLIKDHVLFQNRSTVEGLEIHPLNRSLLSLNDDHWKRVRSIVAPSFSPSKIKLMVKEINYCAGLLVDSLLEKVKAKQPVDARYHAGCFTVDVIASTAFGVRTHAYTNPDEPFVYHAHNGTSGFDLNNPLLFLALTFPRLSALATKYLGLSILYPRDSVQFLWDVTEKIIEKRKDVQESGRCDMLSILMEANENKRSDSKQENKKLSRDELRAMGIVAFLAGYKATSTMLSFFAYVMSTQPEIQEKLVAEIDAKFPSDDIDVSYDDLSDLPYLDQVVNETLRMYPPGVRLIRMTSHEKDVELDGQWFPANTVLEWSVWQMHHDPALWEEPDKFKPERFSAEEKRKRDPFTFQPFSQGPRNCPGRNLSLLEAKIAIIHTLKTLTFIRCPETEEPLELMIDLFFLYPKRPIKVGVELRKKE